MMPYLFHACMSRILGPLKSIGLDRLEMTSGDGAVRRCHPLFALFVGDYPEQVLVTCVTSGDCPTCPAKRAELGHQPMLEYRDMTASNMALHHADDTDLSIFVEQCQHLNIKLIPNPFWCDLPLVHIYRSVCPDILHQLYQGALKYIFNWVKTAYSPTEIDAQCRQLPPNHNIRLFTKGVTTLSHISGQEHSQICRIMLGLIVGLNLPNGHSSTHLIQAVRAMLNTLYLSQYPLHSDATLTLLKEALHCFDDNKQIFIDLGIHDNFNINKFHYFHWHYVNAIRLFGSCDNYNTEYTERLHINLVKDAYRATN